MALTKIFYATDLHGSLKCWIKFLNAGKMYKANCLILGGDMTGKAVVPIVKYSNGEFRFIHMGKDYVLPNEAAVEEHKKIIENAGYYPYVCDEKTYDELKAKPSLTDELFDRVEVEGMKKWVDIAAEKLKGTGIKCFICPGNDDKLAIDKVFTETEVVTTCEGKVQQIDGHHELIGCGWTNPTPWKLYREETEEELYKRLDNYISLVKDISNCVCDFHAPPYQSGLDEAQLLTGSVEGDDLKPKYGQTMAVGSTAVRSIVEKYQPLVVLAGHIHEGRGMTKIGRTECFNPGSAYEQGMLLGVVINLTENSVKNSQAVFG